MQSQPTAMVVASTEATIREAVQKLFTSKSLRVYVTDDVVGVEVGGALKNVFAIGGKISKTRSIYKLIIKLELQKEWDLDLIVLQLSLQEEFQR
jgi:hypothetical protein